MKKLWIIGALCALFCSPLSAQEPEADQIAKDMIPLTPIVLDNNIPAGAHKLLANKMTRIAAKNGCVAFANGRYIITCSADILSKDITATVPAMHAYTVSITFYVGDGVEARLFSSYAVEVKGVGETPEKAYINAFKAIRENDPGFKIMMDKGKDKIIAEIQAEQAAEAKRVAAEKAARAAEQKAREEREAKEQAKREERELAAEAAREEAARHAAAQPKTNKVETYQDEKEEPAKPAKAAAKPNYQVKGKWFK